MACDTEAKRFVWNLYNQVARKLYRHDNTNSWAYALAAFRAWNNNTANKVEFIHGLDEKPILAEFLASAAAANFCGIGIALDAANVSDACVSLMHNSGGMRSLHATYYDFPGIGYHYLAMVERSYGTSTATFYGDNGFTDASHLSALLAFHIG